MKDSTYVAIPSMSGTDGDASFAFFNATFKVVSETTKKFPDPDFGAWLMEELYNKKKIFAEKKGLFQKRLLCPACGTELSSESQGPRQIEYELQYKQFPPFSVRITLPAAECTQCKKVSAVDPKGSLGNHLNEAIIHAFESENIRP